MHLESFIGKATLAVDTAGRTSLPKEFRKVLSDEAKGHLVVTIGVGNTLALYPLPEWARYIASLETLGRGPEISKFRTRITAFAKYSVLDAQNRISLTPEQLKYAGVRNEVTFVGDGKRIRIWSPERYAAEIESVTSDELAQFEKWF